MPLRADLFEADIERPASPPVILDRLNWIPHGGRQNWCWAACAVMVELYNEKALPGTPAEVRARLCKTANKILGGGVNKCCKTKTDCDETLTLVQVNELWEGILHHPAKDGPPKSSLVDDMSKELRGTPASRGKAIVADLSTNDLIGHMVTIYGFVETTTERFFFVHDPALDTSEFSDPHRRMPASVVKDRCRHVWFDLEVRP